MTLDQIEKICDEQGFWVNKYDDMFGQGKPGWEVGQSSSLGEDWFESFEANDVDTFISALESRINGWDSEEEAMPYIEMRGESGVPSSIRDLLDDADWKLEQLEDLLDAIKEASDEEDDDNKEDITDASIETAIQNYIEKSNGVFTDDSAYDVAKDLTGITDIDSLPDGLIDNIRNILHTKFNNVEESKKITESDDEEPEENKNLSLNDRVAYAYENCRYSVRSDMPTVSDIMEYMGLNVHDNKLYNEISDVLAELGYDWQLESKQLDDKDKKLQEDDNNNDNDNDNEDTSNLDELIKKWEDKSPLYERVIGEIIDDSENYEGTKLEQIKARLDDISYGLVNGTVSSLIYYDDTNKFFEEYYNDIWDVIQDWSDQGIEPLEALKRNCSETEIIMSSDNFKCYVVWMVYEEIAYLFGEALAELNGAEE